MKKRRDRVAPQHYRELAEHPAFVELLDWLKQRYMQPHLEAPPPHRILPNYGEECAYRAAQYAVVRDMLKYLDSHKE